MPYDHKRFPNTDAELGDPARLGEELRDARMGLGYSIEEMAEALRIRRVYLVALEEGRVRDLPGAAYAVGFVRTYARALGLDEDEMVRRFRDHSGAVVRRKTDLVFPEPVPDRGLPPGAVILVGAVLAVVAYAGWYHWSGAGNRTVDAVPPVPPHLEQQAAPLPQPAAPAVVAVSPTVPAPATPAPAAPASATSGSPQGTAPAAQAVAPGPAAVPQVARSVPAPPPVGFPPGGVSGGAPVPAPPQAVSVPPIGPAPAATPASAAPENPANRIQLRANHRVWIMVRDTRHNTTLVNRTLNEGETYDVPNGEGLVLSVGAAQNLGVAVDGQAVPALDNAVGARRNLPLDPEKLKAGPIAAAPPPRPAPRPVARPAAAPASGSGESEADALMRRMNHLPNDR